MQDAVRVRHGAAPYRAVRRNATQRNATHPVWTSINTATESRRR